MTNANEMLTRYRKHVDERASQGIPPLPLSAQQMTELAELLEAPPAGEEEFLMGLLEDRVPAGVDGASLVKCEFLTAVTAGERKSPLISKTRAVEILGTMLGGYNVNSLVKLLEDGELGALAASQLKHTLLVADAFGEIEALGKGGNANAQAVMQSWADAEWFTSRPPVPDEITLSVFKVVGETNTDDLSPAPDAWSRPDIPLHGLSMLKIPREGITNAIQQIEDLEKGGNPVAYVGDVVGTGSSRKSATNSVLWHMGEDIPHIPNKRAGGVCLGGKIAPIFFNTLEDSGALPIECDVTKLNMGDVITVCPHEGKIFDGSGGLITTFELKTEVLLDEVQAGGRIPLIIGRTLTGMARKSLGLEAATGTFRTSPTAPDTGKGYTLAQKMVGRACGLPGVRPGSYCEPTMSTVGSQDTTGPMTRDELKELACLKYSADLVLQSFCHTAAYPKPVDVETHATLPHFMHIRGGVALNPGDGIIHSWLNRMLLPDQVGTGGDSHTRFPLGLSFPAGSGLVAFAAALGMMPLDMPEAVLVRFTGEMQPGITLRDMVNAIPYMAIQSGDLTVAKEGKKNIFSGRIVEIEGLPQLSVEQAFELSDSSAERSAAGCTIKLNEQPVIEYLKSNVKLLRSMVESGYQDAETLERRAQKMEAWIANPELLSADADAEYAHVIEVDMSKITEPVLACPNDPDDVKLLSELAGTKIDEVFIGSCMTNIGHFRAASELLKAHGKMVPTRLWLTPPTKMDEKLLSAEGVYSSYASAGARTEMPGCSLCMGNQARVAPGATVVSTSTRNFPNRLGDGANVYLASAELATVASILGQLPTPAQYLEHSTGLEGKSDAVYSYMSFDQIEDFAL